MPLRQKSMNSNEVFSKIQKTIAKFAIHHHLISFVLKSSLSTIEMSSANISRAKSLTKFNIKRDLINKFYGDNIQNNLLEMELNFEEFHAQFYIILTKPNLKIKGKQSIIFINGN